MMSVIAAEYCVGCRAVYPGLSGELLLTRCPSCREELVEGAPELTGLEEDSWAAAPDLLPGCWQAATTGPNPHQLTLIARASIVIEYDPEAYGIEDGSVRRGLFIARPAHQPRHLAGLGLSDSGALQALAWELRHYALRHPPSSALLRANQLLHAGRSLPMDRLRTYLESIANPPELRDSYGLVLREAAIDTGTASRRFDDSPLAP